MLSSLLLQDCSESSPKDGLLISDDYDHHVAPPSQGPIRLIFTLSGFSSHITMQCQTRDVNSIRMENNLNQFTRSGLLYKGRSIKGLVIC